jgi:hypothetical protein
MESLLALDHRTPVMRRGRFAFSPELSEIVRPACDSCVARP